MTIGNVGTKLAGNFSKLAEDNKGKGPLDPQEEYIFELVETDHGKLKGFQSAEDKAAGKPAPMKEHAKLTWRELKTGIKVFQKFNIETISYGNGQTDPKRSKVLKFLEDIGMPQTKDKIPIWDNIFIPTMKIRARVIPSTKAGQPVPDEYVFKDGSFRKFQA